MRGADSIPILCPLLVLAATNGNVVASTDRHFRNVRRAADNEQHRDLQLDIQPRIVGGTPANGANYPFYAIPIDSRGLCGATLVHPDILISAAHCSGIFIGNDVAFGASTIDGSDALETIRVSGEYPNPAFSYNTLQDDVMVIKLARPSTATPVPLNDVSTSPAPGETVTVIGFGAEFENGRPSRELMEVQVEVVDYETCSAKYWQPFWGSSIVEEKMICAGTPAGSSEPADSCQGDSGGPMMTSTGAIAGIVSFGSGCGRTGIPGVYTRVSSALDFIRTTICDASSSPPDYCGTSGGGDGDGTGGDGDGTGGDGDGTGGDGDGTGGDGDGTGGDGDGDGGGGSGDNSGTDLSECTLECTFAYIFRGLVLHIEQGSSCEAVCAFGYFQEFFYAGYKCGLCPN